MLTYFQVIVLGLMQGFSELFPISSLGHSVILPQLLGWNVNQKEPFFLVFLVFTHLATSIVLIGFFWKDWLDIIKGMGRSLARREIRKDDASAKLGWLLVVGTIPAGILGLLLQEPLSTLFASAKIAAFFLMVNGAMLYGAELLRRRAKTSATAVTWVKSFFIGTVQAIALVPGFSRSGASMAGGLLAGLSHEDAARFSFLLATPIILAAALLKVPELFMPENRGLIGPAVVGALCSGTTAYFSIRFLMRFFKTNKLTPFAGYCFVAGALSLLWLTIR